MKKLLPGILAMLMCFGVMAACGGEGDSSSAPDSSNPIESSTPDSSTPESSAPLHEHEKDLNDVKDYVQGLLANKNLDTRVNYTVINTYSFFGEEAKYDIAWSTDVEGVTIEEGETEDTVVIAELAEDTPYVLTATITDPEGCHSLEVSFDGVALKALTVVPEAITEKPAENTAYKLYVYQAKKAADCYFMGEMSGFYFKTSELSAEGVDLYVEYIADSEEFNIYFNTEDGAKTYIGVQEGWNSKNNYWTFNVVMGETAPSSFVWSEDLDTIITTVPCRSEADNKNQDAEQSTTETLYLGNYDTYMTFSASKLNKASTSNVGGLVKMIDKSTITADVKVAFEKEALSVETEVIGEKTIELAAKGSRYSEVAITWAVVGDNATLADNVLTLANPAADTTITLTAILTCGDVTETKVFTIASKYLSNLPAFDTVIDITKANEIGVAMGHDTYTEGKYYVVGTVTEIKNTKYGNLYIQDAAGNQLYVYGVYSADGSTRYDAMESAPQVGDTITVYGRVGQYNGTAQMKDGWLTEAPEEGVTSIPDANAIGAAKEHDTYTEEKYCVSGTVVEIKSTKYGNLYIQDAAGNKLYVYGVYSADGELRYDAMESAPQLGDTIKVFGVLGQYNGNPQMKNGWVVDLVKGEAPETPDEPETPETPEVEIPEGASSASVSIADYAAANAWVKGTLYAEVKVNDDITVSVSGTPVSDYGQNTGKYYDGDTYTWRIYQNENPTITVTAAEGKTILSVIVTYLSQNDGVLTQNGANVASEAVVSVNASSVTFNVANTGTKTNGQARITAIQVIYA